LLATWHGYLVAGIAPAGGTIVKHGRKGLRSNRERPLQFYKRSQYFISTHDETFFPLPMNFNIQR